MGQQYENMNNEKSQYKFENVPTSQAKNRIDTTTIKSGVGTYDTVVKWIGKLENKALF